MESTEFEADSGEEVPSSSEDPEIPRSLQDLPNELLYRILSYLDNGTLSRVTQVSRMWYAIVNEMLGRRLFVGKYCDTIPHDHDEERHSHQYLDISLISEVGVRECFVGEVVEPQTNWLKYLYTKVKNAFSGNDGTDVPQFRHPHLIKSLYFDGPIPQKYFSAMVLDAGNLARIEFHTIAFCSLSPTSFENLRWRRLRTLKIWGHKLMEGTYTRFYYPDKIIANILTLLSNTFPSLKSFCFEYPYDIREERPLTDQMLTFLRLNTTLEKFRTCVNIFVRDGSGQHLDTMSDRERYREAKLTSKDVQLKNLEIVSSLSRSNFLKLWWTFLQYQKSLQVVVLMAFHVPLHLLTTICDKNSPTLHKLYVSKILMSDEARRDLRLNCGVLSACSKLTHLTLEGMQSRYSREGLYSANLLPKCITHLDISRIPIIHDDARAMLFELPALSHITLTDITTPNSGIFGVTVTTVQEVIAERRILVVSLYRSVSGDFPHVGLPNGDRLSTRVRMKPYEIFEVKLNAAGYYENMSNQGFEDPELSDD